MHFMCSHQKFLRILHCYFFQLLLNSLLNRFVNQHKKFALWIINIYKHVILILKKFKSNISGLEQSGKCPSNGSLLSQNGIKYSSEPELQKKV